MDTPRAVLTAFMKAMNEWEVKCAAREANNEDVDFSFKESKATGMTEYMEIFTKFCAQDSIPRNYSFSAPPDYDPEKVTFISEKIIKPTTIDIRTKMPDIFNSEHLYRMILEDGEWKIHSRKYFSRPKKKFLDDEI